MARSVDVGTGALLLKDAMGEKPGYLLNVFKPKEVPVLRGTLLIMTSLASKNARPATNGKPAQNFGVYNDDISLYCSELDVAPLVNYEFQLLNGISKPGARFDVFISDTLDWGSKLKVGNTVYVALPTKEAIANNAAKGVVRWIGILPGEEGTKFGVEIMEKNYRGSGSTNGVFQGKQLFVCEEDCGMFVSLEKLSPTPDIRPANPQPSKPAQPKSKMKETFDTAKEKFGNALANTFSGPAAGTRSQAQRKDVSRFRIGDRVVCHNKDQIPIHGTVRWTGEGFAGTDKVNVVGIETDISVKREDFFLAFTGLHSNFKCIDSKHGKIVLPEELVQTELEATQEKNKVSHDNLHLQHNEKEMLRDANIESVALNEAEQERMIREYNKERDEMRKKQKSIGGIQESSGKSLSNRSHIPPSNSRGSRDAPASSHEVHRPLKQSPANHPDPPPQATPRPKEHIYDTVDEAKLGYHSESGSNLARQNSQSTNGSSVDPTISNIPGAGNGAGSGAGNGTSITRAKAPQPSEGHPQYQFAMGSRVQFGDPPRYGEIRWIGNIPQVEGLVAGVELDEAMDGCFDGTWRGQRYFSCHFGRGFFCPVTTLEPRVPLAPHNSTPPLHRRSKSHPQVPAPREPSHHPQNPTADNSRWDPRHHPQGPAADNSRWEPKDHPQGPADNFPRSQDVADNSRWEPRPNMRGQPADISLNTAVQIGDPQNPWYGIVKWIGHLPGSGELIAGIELEEYNERFGNGEYNGTRYFKCDYGKAYFCPVIHLRVDNRFADPAPSHSSSSRGGNPLHVPMGEQSDQGVPYMANFYEGSQKGIQGNQNSCYLDSSLFGLFALSDIFDEMFLAVVNDQTGTTDINRRTVSDMLWKGIVNPLRKNGVVRFESVMLMRNKLSELGKMEGLTEKEKDPEEFLNMLFKLVLRVTPFISIKRPFGVEQEFFVQLFVEPDPNLRLPTVGDLITKMFKEQEISFTEIPSKFLLQVPRFGREFKAYSKIIPELKLNICEITESGKTPPCMFCGLQSKKKCSGCAEEFSKNLVDNKVHFCDTCSPLAHMKEGRKQHKLELILNNDAELYKLDLLSVICIETSHYVCFTRDLNSNTWLFFDSMADRVHDTYNIPQVTDCTRELDEWVYHGDRERLINTPPRELPELVRRFTQDIYMCVYVQPDIAMYGGPENTNK